MKTTKNPCSNVSTESYTGKEQSPKRFGLSAEGFDINYEKEGFDKQIWTVQMKNNRKVWVRKNNNITITHEEPVIPDNNNNNNNEGSYGSDNNDDIIGEDEHDEEDKQKLEQKSEPDLEVEQTLEPIKDIEINNNIEPEPKKETIDITIDISIDNTTKTDKKKTDYNVFLPYYLNKLKNEDSNKKLAHKIIFQMAVEEWARLKKNPIELKTLIENIKK